MKKIEVQRFESLIKNAEEINATIGFRRFYPIRSRDGSQIVFGIYDYEKKRYTISNPYQDNLSTVCDEIEEMISQAKQRQKK